MTRHEDPLFDPRLADWLEDDPHTAPDQALEVVLASLPSIKQRRAWGMPWRNRPMISSVRYAVAAAVVVAAVAGGIYLVSPRATTSVGGSPSAPPSVPPASQPAPSGSAAPSASATAGPGSNRSTFTSPLHGYTIEHPAVYRATPATEEWTDGVVGNAEPWVDRFFAPVGGAAFVGISAQSLPEGMTPTEWLDAYVENAAGRGCAVPVDNWGDATVGDAPARRAEFDCGDTAAVDVAWVVEGRGYVITGEPPVVDLILATIRYE